MRNSKEKSPFDQFMEDVKQKYVDVVGDKLTWEEFLAHELFNAVRMLEWYEQRDEEEIDKCCGGCNCDCNC
jgi:hypothetical protein